MGSALPQPTQYPPGAPLEPLLGAAPVGWAQLRWQHRSHYGKNMLMTDACDEFAFSVAHQAQAALVGKDN